MSCPECDCKMYSHRKSDSSNSIKKLLAFFKGTSQADEIKELKAQIEDLKKQNKEISNQYWRKINTLSEVDNMNLPIPRLEIRYSEIDHGIVSNGLGTIEGRYSLINRHLMGHIEAIPLGFTKCNGPTAGYLERLELPFRDGAHMQNEMVELDLPGYVVAGDKSREILLDDVKSIPYGVQEKLKERFKL